MNKAALTVLGTRGSVPVTGGAFQGYGQGTACLLLHLAGQTVILDAGTGLLDLREDLLSGPVTMLLTHSHVDHLLGFPMWPPLMRPDFSLTVLGKTRNGLTAEQQLERLMSPPLWPVKPSQLPAEIRFGPLEDRQRLGDLTVTALEGSHPGGVSLLRLEGEGRSVVLMTDCTVECPERQAYLDFARDCDLLCIDGQYSPEEWPAHSAFGHSTWLQAAQFGRDCGARATRILHHDPGHTDQLLDRALPELREIDPGCSFARAGEEITL